MVISRRCLITHDDQSSGNILASIIGLVTTLLAVFIQILRLWQGQQTDDVGNYLDDMSEDVEELEERVGNLETTLIRKEQSERIFPE